jgi:hypothetical protein
MSRAGVLAAAAALSCCGCVPGYVRLSVRAAEDTNRRQPLYMLVRTLPNKAYLGETYADVAAKLTEPDASVLRRELIIPGQARTMYIKQPKGPLAVYFLFTEPGGSWRMLVEPPLPWQVKTALRGNLLLEKSTAF